MSTVRRFYDKLIQLPLEEKAPALYSCFLITKTTLERVGKSCHYREVKNGSSSRMLLRQCNRSQTC